jgi:cell division protein FtsZ
MRGIGRAVQRYVKTLEELMHGGPIAQTSSENQGRRSSQLHTVTVVGVGGGGSNAVNHMYLTPMRRVSIGYVALNTDRQHLDRLDVAARRTIGTGLTKGMGAGGDPVVGGAAAEESRDDIREVVEGSDLVFIAAGMGGGTGTGAAPVVAEVAHEMGALVVAVVTLPFTFEGSRRRSVAEAGLARLVEHADTTVVVPNDRLLEGAARTIEASAAFALADECMRVGVQSIARLVAVPGDIILRFDELASVLSSHLIGELATAHCKGSEAPRRATIEALDSPLLTFTADSMESHSVLYSMTVGPDVPMEAVAEATAVARARLGERSSRLFGLVTDQTMRDEVQVTVIATGTSEQRSAYSQRPPEERRTVTVKATRLLDIIDQMEQALASTNNPTDEALAGLQQTLSKSPRVPFTRKKLVSDGAVSSAIDLVRTLQKRDSAVEPNSAAALTRLLTELRRRINEGTITPTSGTY